MKKKYKSPFFFALAVLLGFLVVPLHAEEEHVYAVVSFSAEDVPEAVAEDLREDFEHYLSNQVKVVERSRIEALSSQYAAELRLGEIGIADESKIRELGKWVPANRFIFGTIRKNSYNDEYTLTVTVINAETAIKEKSRRISATRIGDIASQMRLLVLRIFTPIGEVAVTSSFSGKLIVDGKVTGTIKSSETVKEYLQPGTHRIAIEYTDRDGNVLHKEEETLRVAENGSHTITFDWTPPGGKVEVKTPTFSGELYIDGSFWRKMEEGGSRTFTLLTGYHTIEFRYTDSEGKVIHTEEKRQYVAKDSSYTVDFLWTPPQGTLVVQARTAGRLYIDGNFERKISAGSSESLTLPVGRHTVRINYENSSEQKRVEIEEDERSSLFFSWKPLSIPMASVKPGSFTMGDEDRINRPERRIRISSEFLISRYEVTNDQLVHILNWARENRRITISGGSIYNSNGRREVLADISADDIGVLYTGSSFQTKQGMGSYPAVEISWYGAAAFCNYLSEMKGLSPAYDLGSWSCDWNASGFRLPTEAEWEYAAGGGSRGRDYLYSGSDKATEVSWFSENSGGKLHPVGTLSPNNLGLYDMSGNASEWCWDWYVRDPSSRSSTDPRGPGESDYRVRKGGAWRSRTRSIEISARSYTKPAQTSRYVGFRIVQPK